MSRTKKGSKGPGYDYHSRRPRKGTKPQGFVSTPGPYTKKLTHRSERRISKRTCEGDCVE